VVMIRLSSLVRDLNCLRGAMSSARKISSAELLHQLIRSTGRLAANRSHGSLCPGGYWSQRRATPSAAIEHDQIQEKGKRSDGSVP
jgi:hypothetical protein